MQLRGYAPVAVVACVLVSVAARTHTGSALWLDEALSVNIARLPLDELLEALRQDGNPPLYYVLLHGWMRLFGEGDTAVRSLSGVLSVATLPLAWLAASRLGGRAAGIWALALVGLSPYAVRYGTEARMYALVMLLVVAGQLLIRAALAAPARLRLVAIALVSGALLLSHYWSIWLVTAVVIVLAIAWRRGHPNALAVAIAATAGGLLLLPWAPAMIDQVRHTGTPWGDPFRPTAAAASTMIDLGGDFTESAVLGALIFVLAVTGVFGHREGRPATVVLDPGRPTPVGGEVAVAALTFLLGSSVSWIAGTTFAGRYASVFVPLLLLGAAIGASVLPRSFGWSAAVILVLVGIGGIAVNVKGDRTQAREVGAAIDAAAVPGDVVAYCPDYRGPAVARVLRSPLAQVTYPDLAAPELIDWRDYTDRIDTASPEAFASEVDRQAAGHAVWFVSSGSHTHRDQCAEVGLELAARRGPPELFVVEDERYFETAGLVRFAAAG